LNCASACGSISSPQINSPKKKEKEKEKDKDKDKEKSKEQGHLYVTPDQVLHHKNILYAAGKGEYQLLVQLLDKEFFPQYYNVHGETALYRAAESLNFQCFQELVKRGCKQNCITNSYQTLIHQAASAGDHNLISYLANIIPDFIDSHSLVEGFTPIHVAASQGHEKCIDVLLEKGAKLNGRTNNGMTALMLTIKFNKKKAFDFLLNKGADVNLKSDNNDTALHLASMRSLLTGSEMIKKLIDKGAKLSRCEGCKKGHGCNRVNSNTAKFVNSYAQERKAQARETLQLSLQQLGLPGNVEAEMVSEDALKSSSMQNAKGSADILGIVKKGDLATLKLLVGNDICVSPTTFGTDLDGSTALHIAAAQGHKKLLQYLLTGAKSTDVNATTKEGWTPLHEAAHGGHLFICFVLLKSSADVTVTTNDGNLALHYFICHNFVQNVDAKKMPIFHNVFNKLTNDGALVNAQTMTRAETPLHYLTTRADAQQNLPLLLSYKPNLNIVDKRGNTPLHLAILARRTAVVQTLLESGLDVTVDAKCFQLANNDQQILELLTNFQKAHQPEKKTVDPEEFNRFINEVYSLVKIGNVQTMKEKLGAKNMSIKDVPIPNSFNQDQRTWLHIAAAEGYVDLVKFLLSSSDNCDINATSATGWTPLHEAANEGHLLVCHYLLSQGASVDVRTKDGTLPLHYFVTHRYSTTEDSSAQDMNFFEMYKFLHVLEKMSGEGRLVNEVTSRNETALHYACRSPMTLANIQLLINQYNCQLNILNKHGCTPLDVAIMAKRTEYFRFLVEAGAESKNLKIPTHYPQIYETLSEIQQQVGMEQKKSTGNNPV